MDILVYIRDGYNEELRYAIRSWCQNLNFDRLCVVSGERPPTWLHPDILIKNRTHLGKCRQVCENLRLALIDDRLSEQLLVCMDDTFVLQPIGEWRNGFDYNRGALRSQWGVGTARYGENSYMCQVRSTYDALKRKTPEPLSFELHAPFRCEKTKLLRILMSKNVEFQLWRSLYGNIYNLETKYLPDLKIATGKEDLPKGALFVSTNDSSFGNGKIGRAIRTLFPTRSHYE